MPSHTTTSGLPTGVLRTRWSCSVVLSLLAVSSSVDARPGQAPFDCTVDLGNGKAYFFKGSQYLRYLIAADRAEPGGPIDTAAKWPGMWDGRNIDAAFNAGNGKAFFFKGGEYLRWDIASDRLDPGYPKPIAGNWPGLPWTRDIDAAYGVGGKAYFFKGGQYVRYDIPSDRADPGYPQAISTKWPGLWDGTRIDAAYHAGNGKAYFFRGSEYARWDIATDRIDPGFPRPIAGKWPGVWGDTGTGPTPTLTPQQPGQQPTTTALPELIDVLLPSLTPIASGCPAEYIENRSGPCSPKPTQKQCIASVVARVQSQNLAAIPTGRLSLEQARDLVIALWDAKKIDFPPRQGFEPVFDSKCSVISPPQLASPRLTTQKPPPYDMANKLPSGRMAIKGTVAGVELHPLQSGANQRAEARRKRDPSSISNLEIRMVVALARVAEFLKTRYGATMLFHCGVTSARGRHYESGITIDFVGACGGQLGACPSATQGAAGLFVGDDWGHKAVPAAQAAPGDPNYWNTSVTNPSYRLDLPSANPLARDFFRALYTFFMHDYRDNPEVRIGQGSFIITPDDASPDQRRGGNEGHREHIHAELTAPK